MEEKMGQEKMVIKPHILCLTLPLKGHINPILQFCKHLASRDIQTTILISTSIDVSKQKKLNLIKIESLPDSTNELPRPDDASWEEHKARYLKYLPKIVSNKASSGEPFKLVLFDSTMYWAMDFAKEMGIKGAIFFTQSCGDCAIYCQLYKGILKLPLEVNNNSKVSLPSLPLLEKSDLPSFIYLMESWFLWLDNQQNSVFHKADWIFINSFDKLEPEAGSWLASQYSKIRTIGPTIPSIFLDQQVKDDKDNKNIEDCIKWLDSKPTGSVVYASLGSLANPCKEQMEEIAWGLVGSNFPFLWVVRDSEQYKLPKKFKSDGLKKGLIVCWCPQLEVLANNAVGCFVTHCGWNSTLEALSLGVPMVAIPQWLDQPTNAKFVEDLWEAGVRVKTNEKGIVTKEEIESCIKEVMVGEKSSMIKKNVLKWKELAKEAISEGGSSKNNIEEFVWSLASA